jgi:hypothetical protein
LGIPQPPKTIVLPKPDPISLNDIEWKIVEADNEKYIALTPEDYEDLSLNMAEILRYIKELNSQLDYYVESLEDD